MPADEKDKIEKVSIPKAQADGATVKPLGAGAQAAALNSPAANRPAKVQAPNDTIEDVDPDENFFSPQQPVKPYGPPKITAPRGMDYPVGYNLIYRPRAFEPVSFAQLHAVANSLGIVRALIETRKDQLLRIPWDIQIVDKPAKIGEPSPVDPRVSFLKQFFKKPDRQTRWHAWCRLLFEDLFVTDAVSLAVQKSQAGVPYAVYVIDGQTITPLIDDFGRRPTPPSPAYQQVIKGLPMIDLDTTELIYAPMHLRPAHRPYGNSPVEQVLLEILMSIQREAYQYNYYKEGTIPDLIVTVPKDWTPAQTSEFQATFDWLLQGNSKLKSKVRFLPGDTKPFEVKQPILKSDYDEWLVRILCFAFSIPPTAFVRMMNRGTAETAQEVALEEGLLPLMAWFKDEIMDCIIQEFFGWTDLEFVYKSEEQLDQLKEMQTVTGYVKTAMLTPDEGREKIGQPPKGGAADELIIISASGATRLEDAVAMASQQLQSAQNDEGRTQEKHDLDVAGTKQQQNHANQNQDIAQETHDKDIKAQPKPAAKMATVHGLKKK